MRLLDVLSFALIWPLTCAFVPRWTLAFTGPFGRFRTDGGGVNRGPVTEAGRHRSERSSQTVYRAGGPLTVSRQASAVSSSTTSVLECGEGCRTWTGNSRSTEWKCLSALMSTLATACRPPGSPRSAASSSGSIGAGADWTNARQTSRWAGDMRAQTVGARAASELCQAAGASGMPVMLRRSRQHMGFVRLVGFATDSGSIDLDHVAWHCRL